MYFSHLLRYILCLTNSPNIDAAWTQAIHSVRISNKRRICPRFIVDITGFNLHNVCLGFLHLFCSHVLAKKVSLMTTGMKMIFEYSILSLGTILCSFHFLILAVLFVFIPHILAIQSFVLGYTSSDGYGFLLVKWILSEIRHWLTIICPKSGRAVYWGRMIPLFLSISRVDFHNGCTSLYSHQK